MNPNDGLSIFTPYPVVTSQLSMISEHFFQFHNYSKHNISVFISFTILFNKKTSQVIIVLWNIEYFYMITNAI